MHLTLNDKQKEQAKDYVLLMLGAPVVKIELDPAQLNFVVDEAAKYVNERLTKTPEEVVAQVCIRLIQEGALILAKKILGRIRSKFESPPGPGKNLKLDGKILLKESNEEYIEWTERVLKINK